MQVTIRRQIKFLGQDRRTGETMDVEIGPKIGQVTEQSLRALVNSGAVEADGMKAESAAGGVIMHLRAKVERLEELVKKQAGAMADMGLRLAKLEAPAKIATTAIKKSRREARVPTE